MSGVYIKGMEMPTSCYDCPVECEGDICGIDKGGCTWNERPPHCPLIPVPEHGDLIDRDALIKDGWLNLHKEVMRMGGYAIHELPLKNPSIPVIIPADKEGEG